MDKKYLLTIKKCLPLVVVITLSLFLRLIWLDRVPIGITTDELDHAADAKAIFYTGRGITGKWTPFSLTPPPYGDPKGELVSLILSPLIGPVGLSLFTAHLPFAIAGTVLVAILYLISLRLFNPFLALIVGLVAAFNPAMIFFSRTGYESPLALVFYFIAFLIILFSKGWKILFSFPFLFLGFFMYIGTKIIFLPFVLIGCFYGWLLINKKKYTGQYLILLLMCLALFIFFIFSSKNGALKRTNELLTPRSPEVANLVNQERRLAIASPLVYFFNNKLVTFSRLFLEKYLGIFSANFLFLYGEGQLYFSLWKHGVFYYLDFVFLFLGFVYLFWKKRDVWLLLVALIMIAPLPSALSLMGTEYTERAILIYPPLIIFIGAGIYFLINAIKKKPYRYIFLFFLIGLYFLQFLNFAHIYFLRNPIYNSEGSSFGYRVLSNYINLAKADNEEVLVLVKSPISQFKMYLFYSGNLEKDNLSQIRFQENDNELHWGNIRFISKCDEDFKIPQNSVVVVSVDFKCAAIEKEQNWLSISQLADGGEIYRIFNDSTCSNFGLGRYPNNIRFKDFRMEDLSSENFCQKFISDLTGYSSK